MNLSGFVHSLLTSAVFAAPMATAAGPLLPARGDPELLQRACLGGGFRCAGGGAVYRRLEAFPGRRAIGRSAEHRCTGPGLSRRFRLPVPRRQTGTGKTDRRLAAEPETIALLVPKVTGRIMAISG